jgi:hypothetical protein
MISVVGDVKLKWVILGSVNYAAGDDICGVVSHIIRNREDGLLLADQIRKATLDVWPEGSRSKENEI